MALGFSPLTCLVGFLQLRNETTKSQPHSLWPWALQLQQLPSTCRVAGGDPGVWDAYLGKQSWDAAPARSTRRALSGSISKALPASPFQGQERFFGSPRIVLYQRLLAVLAALEARCCRTPVLCWEKCPLGWWQLWSLHGGSGWKQGMAPGTSAVQQDLQQARCSRHLQGQSFSEHLTYTGSRGGWVGHSTAAQQSRMDSRGRKEGPLVCFYILYVYLRTAPWRLMFTTSKHKKEAKHLQRPQAEGRQDLSLPCFSCPPRCHLCQGRVLVLAPSSSWWAGTSPSQAVLASSRGFSASLRRLLCISAPLEGTGRHRETKQRDKNRDKG